jgi:hypothetical protein
MEETNNAISEVNQLILRRLEDPCPWQTLLVPVAAALILYPLLMYQRNRRSGGPAWANLITRFVGPPWALGLFLGGCALYVFLGMLLIGVRPVEQQTSASRALAWWLIVGSVMAVAFVYVALMYYRDSRSVGYAWASFLGVLRSIVYLLLAFVFLQPEWQKVATTQHPSEVIVVFDVSDSMNEVDDIPIEGQDLSTLLSRQDKVLKLLTADQNKFLKNLHKTNPVTVYRFGRGLDEDNAKSFPRGEEWTKTDLAAWLKIDPDRIQDEKRRLEMKRLINGTNLGDSLLQVLNKHTGKTLQAIIVFSDGQSNEGSEQAYDELKAVAKSYKPPVPIMCVGVGKYKPPVGIKVNDLEVPNNARPDEPFPVVVPVQSQGLKGEEYEVILEVSRIKDKDDAAIAREVYGPLRKKSVHKEGEADRVEFEINVGELKKINPKEDAAGELLGSWEFRARVARNPREAFNKPFHLPKKEAVVKVKKEPLRVLLFAGGPSKEYQFVKTLFYREAIEKRMEVGVYLQTNKAEEIDLDKNKPQEWILDHFPDIWKRETVEQKPYTLSEYHLIIAFDPDWTELSTETLKMLEEWVKDNNGGIVFIGGIVNTWMMARPPKEPDMTPILNLMPVIVEDSRLEGVGSEAFDPTMKTVLRFPGINARFDFLKLNEEGEGTTAGWNEFFYGTPDPDREATVVRGFYSFYPVKQAKSVATVIATFPLAKEVGGEGLKGDQPYMVDMPAGTGKSFFIGSQEIWRLRNYRTAYHERFWIKLARYVGSGNLGRLQKFGESNIPETMTTGKRRIEYRLRGPDLKFLGKEALPLIVLMRKFNKDTDKPEVGVEPKKIPLKDKPSSGTGPSGWFMADVDIREPGKYQFELKIPNTPEVLTETVIVEEPNPEKDNTKPNHLRLWTVASENQFVLARAISDQTKRKIHELEGPDENGERNPARKGKNLYFDMDNASIIPDTLITETDTKTVRGKSDPWWDKDIGETFGDEPLFDSDNTLFGYPFKISFVLSVIVVLLSAEWLTRKLLKLA